ncbi:1,4-alpha-D-glucan glucohydrolase [Lachancea thermotolerans]
MGKNQCEQGFRDGARRKWPRISLLTLGAGYLLWVFLYNSDAPSTSGGAGPRGRANFATGQPATTHNVTISDFNPQGSVSPTSAPDYSYYQQRIQLRPLISSTVARDEFEAWLQKQTTVSFERLLANIGDVELNNLSSTDGVAEGGVIASPSKQAPNYFYQWVRDSAITINTVVSHISNSSQSSGLNLTLVGTVLKYINNSCILQRTANPSGSLQPELEGLGEPKWEIDDSAFTGSWGRPQNDGPPLRAITTLNFLSTLNQSGHSLENVIDLYQKEFKTDLRLSFQSERELIEQALALDLNFVVKNWRKSGFDLWEEVNGQHFFTALCQLKAVSLGWNYYTNIRPEFDNEQKSISGGLHNSFEDILNFLLVDGGFLNPAKNYIVETPQILGQRSGLDIAILIGSLLTHDSEENSPNSDKFPFDVNDSGILNSLYGLVKQMEILYPVNHQRANLNLGVALGRYPEDIYNGVDTSEGNPWFLATSAAAEVLYKVIWHYQSLNQDLVIPLDGWQSEFWSLIFERIDFSLQGQDTWQLVIPYHSPAYNQTMVSLFTLGDSFLDKVREHVSDEGEMSEQFNRYTGFLQGARHLTWSYGAFWSSRRWRDQALKALNAPN